MLVAYHVSFLVVRQIDFIKNQLEKIYEPMSICRHACEIKHTNARFSINIYILFTPDWTLTRQAYQHCLSYLNFRFLKKKRQELTS